MGSGQTKEVEDKEGNHFDITIVVDKGLQPKLIQEGSKQLDNLKHVGRKYGIFEIGFMIDSKVIEIEILNIPAEKLENNELMETLQKLKIISGGGKRYKVKSIEIKKYKDYNLYDDIQIKF